MMMVSSVKINRGWSALGTDVLKLQALARVRWRVLLGHPSLHQEVGETVSDLTRRNPDLETRLREWTRASKQVCRREPRAVVAYRLATRRLAEHAARADRLGATAAAARAATERALTSDSDPHARAHQRTIRRAFEQYLEHRNRLVTQHLGLVRMEARRLNVPLSRRQDMVHEGIFGLMRALECFDPLRGTRFSTYASYWIRTEILRARTRCEREIRVPPHVLVHRRAYVRSLASTDDQQPQPIRREQAKAAAGLTESQLQAVESIPEVEARDSMDLGPSTHRDPISALDHQRRLQGLWLAMPTLTQRERKIIAHRFELEGKQERTLRELAAAMGISRERVRQLQVGALEKLRVRMKNAQVSAA